MSDALRQGIDKYALIVCDIGREQWTPVEGASAARVRYIARGIKKKPGRSFVVTKNGAKLNGGLSSLESIVYDRWLRQCVEDEVRNEHGNIEQDSDH